MQRSYCGLIDLKSVEETLIIKGWVNTRRDHGGVIFIDLRKDLEIVQVVIEPDEKEIFNIAETIRNEFVIEITGKVKARPDGTQNKKMATGEIEVYANKLNIFSNSQKFI